jgi:hypothetical protein
VGQIASEFASKNKKTAITADSERQCRGGTVYLSEIRNAEHEADGVENVALARAVEARDGVELLVEARHDSARAVALEAVQNNFFDEHLTRTSQSFRFDFFEKERQKKEVKEGNLNVSA